MPPRGNLSPDPYRVLGVPRDATSAQIRAAYRALLLTLHPDTGAEPADPALLTEVVAAHALLRDPHRRAEHDAEHPTGRPPAPTEVPIPVRVHKPRSGQRHIRVSPVRHHPHR